MGVHPACPVCSIVAASLVAVETDVGELISVAKVAFVCRFCSVDVLALLSVVPRRWMLRIWWILLRWKELSLFSCLAYVAHVSLS